MRHTVNNRFICLFCDVFNILIEFKTYFVSENDLTDLSESLDILDTNEIKRIGRSLNGLNINGCNTKRNIKNLIINYLNTSQPVFKSQNHSNTLSQILLKS